MATKSVLGVGIKKSDIKIFHIKHIHNRLCYGVTSFTCLPRHMFSNFSCVQRWSAPVGILFSFDLLTSTTFCSSAEAVAHLWQIIIGRRRCQISAPKKEPRQYIIYPIWITQTTREQGDRRTTIGPPHARRAGYSTIHKTSTVQQEDVQHQENVQSYSNMTVIHDCTCKKE